MQNADLGLPSLPGVGGERQLGPDLAGRRVAHAAAVVRRPEPRAARAARLAGGVRPGPQRHRPVDLVEHRQERHPPHRADRRSRTRRAASASGVAGDARSRRPTRRCKAITPSTKVSTDGTAVVAGRSAYELVLAAAGHRLAGRLGADRDRRQDPRPDPRAGVRARTPPSRPSRSASPPSTRRTPAASVFRFNPPPGTKVTQSAGTPAHCRPGAPGHADSAAGAAGRARHARGRRHRLDLRRGRARLPAGSARPGPDSLSRMLRGAAQGQRHLGLGSPAAGHAVLGAAHRRRPGRGRRGRTGRALRRPGRLMTGGGRRHRPG